MSIMLTPWTHIRIFDTGFIRVKKVTSLVACHHAVIRLSYSRLLRAVVVNGVVVVVIVHGY